MRVVFLARHTLTSLPNIIKIPSRVLKLWSTQRCIYVCNPTTKTKLKKAITRPKFCRWLPIANLLWILQWYTLMQTSDKTNEFLQNVMNQNQHLNPTIKTKSKKGCNSAKIWLMITNIELDLYFTMIQTSVDFEWNQYSPSNVIDWKLKLWTWHRQWCRQRRGRHGQTAWSVCLLYYTGDTKTWLSGAWLILPDCLYRKLQKSSCQRPSCSSCVDAFKTGPPVFLLFLYKNMLINPCPAE